MDPIYADRLIPVRTEADIPEIYKDTAQADLLKYHNLDRPYDAYTDAKLLIGMCMDNRKFLHIPDNFAYIIRTGGANLRNSEFKVSYAIAVGDVNAIALIGHNHCGMVNLHERKDAFIQGLMKKAGWSKERAEEHFMRYEHENEIRDEIDFVLHEVNRLRMAYPGITIAPMFYLLEDNKLYLIKENHK